MTLQYFLSRGLIRSGDAAEVSWCHGVNSRGALMEALSGNHGNAGEHSHSSTRAPPICSYNPSSRPLFRLSNCMKLELTSVPRCPSGDTLSSLCPSLPLSFAPSFLSLLQQNLVENSRGLKRPEVNVCCYDNSVLIFRFCSYDGGRCSDERV